MFSESMNSPGAGAKGQPEELWRRLPVRTFRSALALMGATYWVALLVYLYGQLGKKQKNVPGDAPKVVAAFTPYMWLVGAIVGVSIVRPGIRPAGVTSMYPACLQTHARGPGPERTGSVGRIDLRCLEEEENYNSARAAALTSRAHDLAEATFLLVLFLFGAASGMFRGRVTNRNSLFLTRLMQNVILVYVLLVISPLFSHFSFYSSLALEVFNTLLNLASGLLALLLIYVFFREVTIT